MSRIVSSALFLGMMWGVPSLGLAGDWFQMDFPFVVSNPSQLAPGQWARFSVQAGDYRMAMTHAGDDNVSRSSALVSNVYLTVPNWLVQPYLGMGVGLGLMNSTPEDVVRSPYVEDSFIWQIGSALVYHVRQSLSLISSIHYVQFQDSNFFGIGHAGVFESPVTQPGLDAHMYIVTMGLRLQF